jgi:hypothetical protein
MSLAKTILFLSLSLSFLNFAHAGADECRLLFTQHDLKYTDPKISFALPQLENVSLKVAPVGRIAASGMHDGAEFKFEYGSGIIPPGVSPFPYTSSVRYIFGNVGKSKLRFYIQHGEESGADKSLFYLVGQVDGVDFVWYSGNPLRPNPQTPLEKLPPQVAVALSALRQTPGLTTSEGDKALKTALNVQLQEERVTAQATQEQTLVNQVTTHPAATETKISWHRDQGRLYIDGKINGEYVWVIQYYDGGQQITIGEFRGRRDALTVWHDGGRRNSAGTLGASIRAALAMSGHRTN